MRIPLCKPFLDGSEEAQVIDVLRSGWLMQGARVAEFERLVKEYVGSAYAVAVSSCSTALHLAMHACGIKPGDEVIVPSLCWVATAAAVEACGARTVFCDVDPVTFNIDPDLIESVVTSRTRAIVAVNLFGLGADLPRICDISSRLGLTVVEDAACSLGAAVGGRQSGTFGRVGCFSFHPRKSITTGEGGMIVGASAEDEELLRSLRSHGYRQSRQPQSSAAKPYDLGDYDKLGYNYRMTDLQAAVGIAQMKKLDWIIARRRAIAATYNKELAKLDFISLPVEPPGLTHTYQSYVIMVNAVGSTHRDAELANLTRNEMMLQLETAGIATRPGTLAVHTLSYYRSKYGLGETDFPNSYRTMRQSIALPLYPAMTESETAYVVEKLRRAHAYSLDRFREALAH